MIYYTLFLFFILLLLIFILLKFNSHNIDKLITTKSTYQIVITTLNNIVDIYYENVLKYKILKLKKEIHPNSNNFKLKLLELKKNAVKDIIENNISNRIKNLALLYFSKDFLILYIQNLLNNRDNI